MTTPLQLRQATFRSCQNIATDPRKRTIISGDDERPTGAVLSFRGGMELTAELLESTLRGLKGDRVHNRKGPRAPMRTKLRIVPFEGNALGQPIDAWTRDICVGGLGVLSPKPIRVNQKFVIRVPREDGTSLHLMCKVRNCVRQGPTLFLIGASFSEVTTSPAASDVRHAAPQVELEAEIRRISNAIIS